MQQMCPAVACLPCLPCWPLIHFASACWCPDLPGMLGHVDFLMLSQRVFPHNLWQFTLWAVNDYESLLSVLPPCSRGGGKSHAPQLSQHGQEHNSELTSISVYVRRQLWAAVPEKWSQCLFSCPYYKSASRQGTGRPPELLWDHLEATVLSAWREGLACSTALEQISRACCM